MGKKRHTTIRLHPDIEREAKDYAQKTSRTFTQLIEDAVVEHMKAGRKQRRQKIVLPTFGDPSKKMSQEEYDRMIERMYEEEVEWYNRLIEESSS